MYHDFVWHQLHCWVYYGTAVRRPTVYKNTPLLSHNFMVHVVRSIYELNNQRIIPDGKFHPIVDATAQFAPAEPTSPQHWCSRTGTPAAQSNEPDPLSSHQMYFPAPDVWTQAILSHSLVLRDTFYQYDLSNPVHFKSPLQMMQCDTSTTLLFAPCFTIM